jgi:hypothetical protein
MDDIVITEEMEREIRELMADFNSTRYVALAILGLLPGDVSGDGDLYELRPLTDDERRRLGLGPESEDLPAGYRTRRTDKRADLVASATSGPVRDSG